MAYTGTTYAAIPLTKIAPAKGVVYCHGLATDARVDRDQQRVSEQWALPALKEWLAEGGTVRMAHNPQRPVGRGVEVDGLYVKSAVIDKQARRLLKHSVLRAYSVGIAQPVIKRDPTGEAPGGIIVGGQLVELSLVDTPSNPGCGVQLVKARADGSPRFVGKAFVTKGKKKHKHDAPLIMCTKCGTELDAGEKYCTGCGKKNRHYLPQADRQIPANADAEKGKRVSKKRKKALRILKAAQRVDILTKAAGVGYPVYSEGQAIRAMLRAELGSCDPAARMAAAEALRRLG